VGPRAHGARSGDATVHLIRVVRGRPKRNLKHRAEPDFPGMICGMKRRAALSFRIEADLPQILVGNTVWRIKRRPVWNTMAAENAAFVCR